MTDASPGAEPVHANLTQEKTWEAFMNERTAAAQAIKPGDSPIFECELLEVDPG